jgi:hypothetical protein
MTDFLYTDAKWTKLFVEVNDPHKEGHCVRFYFDPPQRTWVGLTDEEMLDAIYCDDTPMERGRRVEAKLKEKNK